MPTTGNVYDPLDDGDAPTLIRVSRALGEPMDLAMRSAGAQFLRLLAGG
ncbi:MAG: hypothetical protein R2939_20155 [Kofleriaceae bacterium]